MIRLRWQAERNLAGLEERKSVSRGRSFEMSSRESTFDRMEEKSVSMGSSREMASGKWSDSSVGCRHGLERLSVGAGKQRDS